MKRTINPTGKIRIELEFVSVAYDLNSEFKKIDVEWDLTSFAFDRSSEVVVEIATLGNTERFVTPISTSEAGGVSFDVPESSREHSTSVRLAVVEPAGQRMILGATTHISLTPNQVGRSQLALLPIQPVANLERAFAVDFTTGYPVLQVSNQDGVYLGLVGDPVFLSSILPSVVETIAYNLMINSDPIDAQKLAAWDRQFNSWGCDLEAMEQLRGEMDSSEDLSDALVQAQELAEVAAIKFSTKFKLNKRLKNATEGDE